ncbi:type II toxin-antitoxin system antitoxin, TscA family [Staphylococcus epidermidis]|uniref:TscA family type II toxin-antitoxin system antitoxin n=1 Tax=Staphylococcus epidermidis TaxID=1282 RepID=UPI00254EEB5C|nr:pathogenicity island protein [Staphylococcus epidermidis]MDK7902807.1 pathogenicity island protein [Staphylococcus epidermidis]MDK8779927.1 pathogenicity island protein [Staphylococcus epidermidis]
MNKKQRETLEIIKYQLKLSINNKFDMYEHIEERNGVEKITEISREKHFEYIMKWCLQELENNFNYKEENINELGN